MSHHYQLLCISTESKEAEILSAFRRLSLKHHPDKGGDGKLFHTISGAKDYCLEQIHEKMTLLSSPSASSLFRQRPQPARSTSISDEEVHHAGLIRDMFREWQLKQAAIHEESKSKWYTKLGKAWTSRQNSRSQSHAARQQQKLANQRNEREAEVLRKARWYTALQQQQQMGTAEVMAALRAEGQHIIKVNMCTRH